MTYIDANALTLGDYALMSNDPLIREVAMSMIKAGCVFQDVPIITDETLKHSYARIKGVLPTINWSPLNGEPVGVKTDPEHREEEFMFFRNSFDFDEYLLRDKNAIDDPRDIQIKAYLESVSYELNDALINNTHKSTPGRSRAQNKNCFVGIRERLDDAMYGQVVSDCKIAATADLSDSGLTSTQGNLFIRQMQSVLDAMGVPEGDDVSFYMNDNLIDRVEAGIRFMGAGGGFDMTKDAFGRTLLTYRNAKIRRVGRITSTESSDGAQDTGSVYTSLYAVQWARGTAYGWQFEPPTVKPEFYLPNGIAKRVVVQGGYGLLFPSNRAIGRLYGVKVA